MSYPDNNPKTAVGAKKVPLHLVPPSATHYLALAFADGAKKYGPYNWRDNNVSTSVYYGAAKRHLDAFWDGEDVSEDAQVHHLAHVMACCAIVLDALTVGMLNDDRPTEGAAGKLQREFVGNGDYDPIHDGEALAKEDPDELTEWQLAFLRSLKKAAREKREEEYSRIRELGTAQGEESKAEQESSVPGLSGLVGSQVLQFPSQWPEGEVDTLASEVFGTSRD